MTKASLYYCESAQN